jgi:hypothetical protein
VERSDTTSTSDDWPTKRKWPWLRGVEIRTPCSAAAEGSTEGFDPSVAICYRGCQIPKDREGHVPSAARVGCLYMLTTF